MIGRAAHSDQRLTRVYKELVVGRFRATSSQNMLAFTKWCPPENGIKSFDAAQQAVDLALQRMGQEQITLMQCLWPF